MIRGKYIVLEGPEGVGKTSQLQELARRMRAGGLPVRTLREPDSQSDLTARSIRLLTQDPQYPMNTRTEVLLYNAARSQSLEAIKNSLDHGVNCLVDRNYLTTLAVQFYGRGDVPDYYVINNIIKFAVGDVEPDLTIVLDAPVQVLKQRSTKRNNIERFDDLDDAFLERVRAGYLWEAKQRNLPLVFANQDFEKVASEIWNLTAHELANRGSSSMQRNQPPKVVAAVAQPEPSLKATPSEPSQPAKVKDAEIEQESGFKVAVASKKPDYYIPVGLSKAARKDYRESLDKLIKMRADLMERSNGDDSIAWLLLPIATGLAGSSKIEIDELLGQTKGLASTSVIKKLSGGYEGGKTQAKLIDYKPRNEIDLLAPALFAFSSSSFQTLQSQIDKWPYDIKSRVISKSNPSDLNSIYTLELLADFREIHSLQKSGVRVKFQPFTPRHGYDVPESIESKKMVSEWEELFDLSLQTYGKIQAAGKVREAQLAVLAGHRQRVLITVTPEDIIKLQESALPEVARILGEIERTVGEVHPLSSRLLFAAR